jgi:flagellar assembly protein FliH
MASPQKFLFDVSFDSPAPLAGLEAQAARFTRADLDAAHAAGREAGREAALAAAAEATEARIAAALDAIDRGIAALNEAHAALAHEAQCQAVALLRAVLQRAVPALCRKDPLAELEAMVTDCLGELLDEPRLVLRVSDALFDAVQQRISGLAQTAGYAGKIVLLADAALADGDGRIEWADGGAERDTRRIAEDVDAFLARALAAPAPRPPAEEILHG